MPETADLNRLRQEYSDREHRYAIKHLYSPFNSAYLFAAQQLERRVLNVLRFNGFQNISGHRILELGCGTGGVLVKFLAYGADPEKMIGIDLLHPRLREAHHKLASSQIVNADGQNLPYSSTFFDLILQFTAFSSILDHEVKHNMSTEMLRVLALDGAILWYDFWLNPKNKQTKGIRPTEIRHLFPNCSFEFHKITLAPPITRKVVKLSWGLALFLKSLKVFNTHYLVLIRRQQPKTMEI